MNTSEIGKVEYSTRNDVRVMLKETLPKDFKFSDTRSTEEVHSFRIFNQNDKLVAFIIRGSQFVGGEERVKDAYFKHTKIEHLGWDLGIMDGNNKILRGTINKQPNKDFLFKFCNMSELNHLITTFISLMRKFGN
jgi:hypothetical protein